MPGADDLIYKVSSIGRPLDPACRTNLAVLMLMPVAAAIDGARAGLGGGGFREIGAASLVGALIVFSSWALARELAPDDNPAAFVSLALAYGSSLVIDGFSVWLMFAALLLVRIVNRSVGPPARWTDSIFVALFTGWTAYHLDAPWLGVVGAAAFFLDAVLGDPRRHQLAFATLSLVAAALVGFRPAEGSSPPPLAWALIGAVTALYLLAIAQTRRIASRGDLTDVPLSATRVRWGMAIGLLAAAQGLSAGVDGLLTASLLWMTLAGVALGSIARTLRGNAPT